MYFIVCMHSYIIYVNMKSNYFFVMSMIDRMEFGEVRSTSHTVFLCYWLVHLMSSSDSDVTEILVTLLCNAYLIKIKVRF